MPRQTLVQIIRQHGPTPLVELPPTYLAPSLHRPLIQTSCFSTTAPTAGRDKSKYRGVSAIHRTGPRYPLTVGKYPLPQPVARKNQDKRETNPGHGLWAFFNSEKQALPTPEADHSHGRPWTIEELRQKSWNDLHSLWWVCVKERNRIATSNYERERLKAGYGEFEAGERERVVKATQGAIKHVLRERWYAWEDARTLYEQGHRPTHEKGN